MICYTDIQIKRNRQGGTDSVNKNIKLVFAVLCIAIGITLALLVRFFISSGNDTGSAADWNTKEHHITSTRSDITKPPEDGGENGGENGNENGNDNPPSDLTADEKIAQYAAGHNIAVTDYPESLVDLLTRNPETEDFVLSYPLNKDNRFTGSLTEITDFTSVPLLMQWDTRWGYTPYGSDVMGLTGCGPTSLSMVAIYLLHDTSLTPPYIADYSIENGYCVSGSGTSWTLMSEGSAGLGLTAEELPLDKNRMISRLEEGKPIICIMGPGVFTESGHYIVITGVQDGLFKINDCNSRTNTEKLWDYDEIKDQIRNLWAFSKA